MPNLKKRLVQKHVTGGEKPKVTTCEDDTATAQTMEPKPDVQCEECSRWVFIDETPFDNLDTAGKSPFKCKICEKMDTIKRSLEEKLDAEKKVLKEMVEEEKQARRKAEAQLALLQDDHDKLKIEVTQAIERMHAEMKTLAATWKPPRLDNVETVPVHTEAGLTQANLEDTTTAGWHKESLTPHNKMNADQQSTETAGNTQGHTRKQYTGTDLEDDDDPATIAAHEEGWTVVTNSKKKSQMNKAKKVLVIGDSNIRRIKAPILDALQWDPNITVKALPGAKAKAVLDSLADNEHTEESLVIVHIGLNDLLNGATPQETAEIITAGISKMLEKNPLAQYGVCSVPMVQTEEPSTRGNIRELNFLLKETCEKMGSRAQFFNTFWVARRLEAKAISGVHFTEAGGRAVGQLLAEKIASFLGIKAVKNHNTAPPWGRSWMPRERATSPDMAQLLSQMLWQLTEQRPQKRWGRSY
ncbi:uncharacterized protein LOC135375941 [Ornithodoros turicata]